MEEFLIKADTLPEAYHKALVKLNSSSELVDCSDWNTKQIECSMTFEIKNPLKEPMISKLFIGGFKELQQYLMEMLDGILDFEIEKGNWVYTYHDRMVNYSNKNQINFVINDLKRNPSSRRAVILIRDKNDIESDDPACLQHIQYFIRDNKLHCKVLFRSNDACKATFMNAFALIMLQKRIADELGVEVGTYTHRANSFHCYEKDINMLNGYCKRIEENALEDITYDYVDGWKDFMDDCIPEIMNSVENLKNH